MYCHPWIRLYVIAIDTIVAFFLILGSLFLFAPSVFAADLCAIGFDPSYVNGTFVDTGTYNGYPYYVQATHPSYLYVISGSYMISVSSLGESGSTAAFYSHGGLSPLDTSYGLNNTPAVTGGTIASGACENPSPTASTTDIWAMSGGIMLLWFFLEVGSAAFFMLILGLVIYRVLSSAVQGIRNNLRL